jgi:hypothetical protein
MTDLPLSQTHACRAMVAQAMRHCRDLACHYLPELTVRCISLPEVKAAQAVMDRAALATDLQATTAAARTYYRVWRAALDAASAATTTKET